MFNQRKSFLKGKLFYIILLALFVFGIWLNQAPTVDDSPEDISTDTGYPSSTGSAMGPENGGYDIMDDIVGKNQTSTPGGLEETDGAENTGYFLVKEVDEVIRIFYYDEEGKESLIRDTDIAFSLLSVADQELFRKGVIKYTPEELNELLQDFES